MSAAAPDLKPISVRPDQHMTDALNYLAADPYYGTLSRTQIIRSAVVYLALQERFARVTGRTDVAPRNRLSDAVTSGNTATTNPV